MSGERLAADCARCAGLCCVALPFGRSADFPVGKAAGQPCAHLRSDYRCGIHAGLRSAGYRGCVTFDCFGAGQLVTERASGSWRDGGAVAAEVFAALGVVRQLHELLWYLREVSERGTGSLAREAALLAERIGHLTGRPAGELAALDPAPVRADADRLLTDFSARARAGYPGALGARGTDLIGRSLAGTDLRGAHLRGALLIAADLRGADLTDADLLGADLRDAQLAGADLSASLFLTRSQVQSANGDRHTTLPASVERPGHWL